MPARRGGVGCGARKKAATPAVTTRPPSVPRPRRARRPRAAAATAPMIGRPPGCSGGSVSRTRARAWRTVPVAVPDGTTGPARSVALGAGEWADRTIVGTDPLLDGGAREETYRPWRGMREVVDTRAAGGAGAAIP